MSSLDLTRDWLQNVLRAYPSKDVIIPQVLSILQTRRSLAVKTDAFTFDTGQTALLLLLHGTLPISFRGATYHIPIHVWIPHEYPRGPPLAFVVPTKEMGVRKGREIDPSGRLKEDVVETWWRSWQDKSIEMLLKQLTSVFEVVPPVYARPPEQQTQAGPSRPAGHPGGPMANQGAGPSTQSPPPPPARPGPGPPMPQQRESLPQYRPAPTPPVSSYQPQIPQSHSRQSSMQYQQSPASPSHSGPPHPGPPQSPPVPQRPQQMPPRQGSLPPSSPSGPTIPQRPYIPQYPGHAYDPNTQRAMTPPRQGPPPHQPVYSPAPVQPGYAPDPRMAPQQPSQQPPALHPQHQIHQYPQQYPLNGYAPSPPPAPKIAAPVPPAQQRPAVQDLMSSPEQATTSLPDTEPTATSPPPLPPSKPPPPSLLHLHSILLPHLNASLPPLITSLQATRQHLIERHEDLSSGEPAIKDEMARLEAVKKVCDAVGKKMEDAVAKGEERVADLEQRGEISVDEVVCGISIVHNQLIDLVAEDNAIEDTIYHMTRALDNERIDLDRFLKAIRMLGREQYMKRALIERILQGMGQTW